MASINSHFKVEGWLMVLVLLVPLLVGLVVLVAAPYISTQLAVDKCLDSGGSYNYETNACTAATKP
jgi:hypothetical protein